MKKIFSKFREIFALPFDPADDTSNRDSVISGLLNISILVVFLYATPIVLTRGLYSAQFDIIMLVFLVFIGLRVLLSKGYGGIVSFTMLFTFWAGITYEFLWLENGLRAPAYTAALALIITFAGVLHNRKVAVLVTLVTFILNGAVVLGELNGFYLTEPKTPDIQWAFFGQLIFFSCALYLLTSTLKNLRTSISRYRAESAQRLEAELDVRRLVDELETAYESTLKGWAQALELRDRETEGHSRRVTEMVLKLAVQLGCKEDQLSNIYYGALLHDIGKMGIPDRILNKRGPLSPEDRLIVNQHPVHAYEMLKKIDYLKPALDIPYCHHENFDGTGYPRGLAGEDIPLEARIFAVIDNWDALTTDRPYRKAWSREKMIQYLLDEKSKKFDSGIVDMFLKMIEE